MRVGILGGTGFLGTNLYHHIRRVDSKVDITIGSRRTGVDVRIPYQVEDFVKDRDLVISAAAQTHVDFSLHGSLEDQTNFLDTNAKGTLNVIHACKKYRVKMIHISTSEVYGTNQHEGVMTEDHPILAQAGIYATSKAFADLTCRMETLTSGADIVILRPFNFWGPYQSVEKLIPRFINQSETTGELTIYGDGEQRRDYVYIQDVAEAIWLAKELPGGTICNIGTGTNISINEIAKMFKVKIKHIESRPAEVKELKGSFARINDLTGWKPKTYIDKESLGKVINWYKTNQMIVQPQM